MGMGKGFGISCDGHSGTELVRVSLQNIAKHVLVASQSHINGRLCVH